MSPSSNDSVGRFTNRVDSYARYRPRYPQGAVDWLVAQGALRPDQAIADVGAGTGILSELLLNNGYTVYAVEPNAAMRAVAEAALSGSPRFHSVDGAAEATTLPAASVGAVTAAQAFHWFNPPAARAEFRRILTPGGWVALLWNDRNVGATPFMRAYEALVDPWGTDVRQVNHKNVVDDAVLSAFFGPAGYVRHQLPNEQLFGWEGLLGRTTSTSYLPMPGDAGYDTMIEALRLLFAQYAVEGKVVMKYTTQIFVGKLD